MVGDSEEPSPLGFRMGCLACPDFLFIACLSIQEAAGRAEASAGERSYTRRTVQLIKENVMTGIGLNDPDEAMREAERRDLETERKKEPSQERGQVEGSPEPDANDDDEGAKA